MHTSVLTGVDVDEQCHQQIQVGVLVIETVMVDVQQIFLLLPQLCLSTGQQQVRAAAQLRIPADKGATPT